MVQKTIEKLGRIESSTLLYYYHCIFASIGRKIDLRRSSFGHSGCIYILIHATLLDGAGGVVQGSTEKEMKSCEIPILGHMFLDYQLTSVAYILAPV
jgi:hypothetical protein